MANAEEKFCAPGGKSRFMQCPAMPSCRNFEKVDSHGFFFALLATPLELMIIRVVVLPVSRNGLLAHLGCGGVADLFACGHTRREW
ncbi:MAG TPA: hypothetical protein VGF13_08145, partial [Verrucomicrobiae bacterium]